uniref:Uncharacterized protein n=1 Tax=Magallana gigas TaxID=29159 RepID=K1PBI3_MAGGI
MGKKEKRDQRYRESMTESEPVVKETEYVLLEKGCRKNLNITDAGRNQQVDVKDNC